MAKAEYKYPANIVQITLDYINSCTMEQMEIPTVEGLALLIDVDDTTLGTWAKKHKDFGKVYRKLKMAQKVQLINGGAFGGKEINASMFIFLLKANHGLSDSTKLDITTKGKELPNPILGGLSNVQGNDSSKEDSRTD